MKFQSIKDTQTRAKSLFHTLSNLNETKLKGSYETRVKEKKDYAEYTNQIAKQLEIEEQQLLNRLQKTYQTEQKMTELLNEVKDGSPVKLKLQSKKQLSSDDKN